MARTAAAVTQTFVDGLNAKFGQEVEPEFTKNGEPNRYAGFVWKYQFWIEPGVKYDRIMAASALNSDDYSNPHVHAFVGREDNGLYKAEGWKKPAKGIRYDISTYGGMADALAAADKHGSYLYKR